MPIIEPEVNIKSPERADADRSCSSPNSKRRSTSDRDGPQVMLKLSLPAERGIYEALIHHPRVLRVVALVGRLQSPRGVRRAGAQQGHDRELQPRACWRICATR